MGEQEQQIASPASSNGGSRPASRSESKSRIQAEQVPTPAEESKESKASETVDLFNHDEAGNSGSRLNKASKDDVRIDSEPQEGNIEYKLRLVSPTPERLVNLVTQMNWRLNEGNNEALYEIGVSDDGGLVGLNEHDLEASLATLKRMAESLGASTKLLVTRAGKDDEHRVAEVLVRRQVKAEAMTELRVAVVGNVDSGKSTLVGVLTKGKLDNGRGLARMQVFRHNHEIESGRTSAVSQQIMGFDSEGDVTNYGQSIREASNMEILQRSSKIVTFCDLAGHEKYLKTTVFGLTGRIPDYVMLVVCAKRGVQRMTKEHLGIALALKLPIFVVITKCDSAPENVRKNTVQTITKILKSPGVRRQPFKVRAPEKVLTVVNNLQGGQSNLVPMFFVSNVTGQGLDELRMFLNLLPTRMHWANKLQKPAQLNLDDHFMVPGVGTVIAGTMYSGSVKAGETLLMGPDDTGEFRNVVVKSIHTKQMPVERGRAGQSVSFALKFPNQKHRTKLNIRKGMVLVHPDVKPKALFVFEAEVLILHHPTTIKANYQPVIHAGNVRQVAQIVQMTDEFVRTGDRTRVNFRFMYHPEYIRLGETIVFREGRTKGVGKVTKLLFEDGTVDQLSPNEEVAFGVSSAGKTKVAKQKASAQPCVESQNGNGVRLANLN